MFQNYDHAYRLEGSLWPIKVTFTFLFSARKLCSCVWHILIRIYWFWFSLLVCTVLPTASCTNIPCHWHFEVANHFGESPELAVWTDAVSYLKCIWSWMTSVHQSLSLFGDLMMGLLWQRVSSCWFYGKLIHTPLPVPDHWCPCCSSVSEFDQIIWMHRQHHYQNKQMYLISRVGLPRGLQRILCCPRDSQNQIIKRM